MYQLHESWQFFLNFLSVDWDGDVLLLCPSFLSTPSYPQVLYLFLSEENSNRNRTPRSFLNIIRKCLITFSSVCPSLYTHLLYGHVLPGDRGPKAISALGVGNLHLYNLS